MDHKKQWIWLLLSGLLFIAACSTAMTEQAETPIITAIYPSSDTLPENVLRMYIHFSKPMKPIGNLENIQLIDDNGREVVGAIFNHVHELWDDEQKQLTLIFDPSRVKTGLIAHEEKGRALQMGRNFTLLIGQVADVEGNKLKEVYTKSFYVSHEDRLSPNPARWTLNIPKANSHSPLIVQFPDMLDRLSLQQRLQLTDQNSQAISGDSDIAKKETEWRFVPSKKWLAGDYLLYVHGRLEDPCGNNLNGLFDHTIGSLKNEQEGTIETLSITIEDSVMLKK